MGNMLGQRKGNIYIVLREFSGKNGLKKGFWALKNENFPSNYGKGAAGTGICFVKTSR